MAKFPSLVLTTDGLNMLAKAGSGKEEDKLIITKARLGDGVFSGNFRELKNVVSPKLDALLSSIVNEGNGKIQATFTYTNNEVEAGFHHREIGILAKNGTTGQEKRLEAISLEAEGLPDGMNIYVRYHIETEGWSDWIKGGTVAGTVGLGKRLEAIQIKIQ